MKALLSRAFRSADLEVFLAILCCAVCHPLFDFLMSPSNFPGHWEGLLGIFENLVYPVSHRLRDRQTHAFCKLNPPNRFPSPSWIGIQLLVPFFTCICQGGHLCVRQDW